MATVPAKNLRPGMALAADLAVPGCCVVKARALVLSVRLLAAEQVEVRFSGTFGPAPPGAEGGMSPGYPASGPGGCYAAERDVMLALDGPVEVRGGGEMATTRRSAYHLRPGQRLSLVPWHKSEGRELQEVSEVRRGPDGVRVLCRSGRVLRFASGDRVSVVEEGD
jgi:hypothetical protein